MALTTIDLQQKKVQNHLTILDESMQLVKKCIDREKKSLDLLFQCRSLLYSVRQSVDKQEEKSCLVQSKLAANSAFSEHFDICRHYWVSGYRENCQTNYQLWLLVG